MDIRNLIFVLMLVHAQATIKCPYFCSCDKWEGLRRISCIGKRLASSEVNAPPQVQALDLSKNSISELREKEFSQNNHLKYLNVSHNKIADIHMSAFYKLTELNILDLSHNHLKYLMPMAFENTPLLQELYLSGNEIGHFGKPPVFHIPSLQILHMKECWLDTLDELTFSQLPNLIDLDLSDNQFVYFKIEYMRSLSLLNSLNLLSNPWHCSSEIEEVVIELGERNVNVTPICEVDRKKEISFNASDMFGRITAIADSSESEDEYDDIETLDEDIYSVWFADDPPQSNVIPEIQIKVEQKPASIEEFMGQIPSLWSFIVGLQLGTVIGIMGMWVWLRCRCSQAPAQIPARTRSLSFSQSLRRSVGRHRTDSSCYTELESVDCPGTPPPPYRDVALQTFR